MDIFRSLVLLVVLIVMAAIGAGTIKGLGTLVASLTAPTTAQTPAHADPYGPALAGENVPPPGGISTLPIPPPPDSDVITAGTSLRLGVPATRSGGRPLSPRVLATWQQRAPEGGPWVLDLLALWRGDPGWSDGTFTVEGDPVLAHVPTPYGALGVARHLVHPAGGAPAALQFDATLRAITFSTTAAQILGDRNVVLLDGLGTPAPRFVGALRIESSTDPAEADLGALSPQLAAWLGGGQ